MSISTERRRGNYSEEHTMIRTTIQTLTYHLQLVSFHLYSIPMDYIHSGDIGDLDRFREGLYDKGFQEGAKEAATRNFEDNFAMGLAYGKQWASEYASLRAFIDEIKTKQETSTNPLLKSVKVCKMVSEIEGILTESHPPKGDIRLIDPAREEARKRYNILLAMLGLKGGSKQNDQNMGF